MGNSAYAAVSFRPMTLQERLEAAKAERRRQAGLPADEPEVSPMRQPYQPKPADDPALDLRGLAPVVDLRPGVEFRAGPPRFSEALAVGHGSACPNCGFEGRLDLEDIAGGVDHFSCTDCGLLYQVAR
jgi:hypothetical protein